MLTNATARLRPCVLRARCQLASRTDNQLSVQCQRQGSIGTARVPISRPVNYLHSVIMAAESGYGRAKT